MKCFTANGENIDELYAAMRQCVMSKGPSAVIIKRKMCPGIEGVEGECHGHDALAVAKAVNYLNKKGYKEAVAWLEGEGKKAPKDPQTEYRGTKGSKVNANRALFGEIVVKILEKMPIEERKKRVMCIDSDLEGSTGLKVIHQKLPEIFVQVRANNELVPA
jgi:hypothetical protein